MLLRVLLMEIYLHTMLRNILHQRGLKENILVYLSARIKLSLSFLRNVLKTLKCNLQTLRMWL